MAPERRKYARKYCKYCEAKIEYIDYKDTKLLNPMGKICSFSSSEKLPAAR